MDLREVETMGAQDKPDHPLTLQMPLIIQGEEVAITAVAIYFLTRHSLGLSFWIWIPLFLIPDISMLGYLFNTRVGAFSYNLFHHRGIALLVTVAGFLLHQEVIIAFGILLFAHSSLDRMFGYGLKHYDSFNNTHLGRTGKT
jgi:hypothetical protein